ncbi:MAG TPA: hypothetical protein VHW60_23890 [Caulobacteraceae bacterium]|jgi:hypothetical protein|nr:hypothetical protein [Caulobacteraceae bacterium]
MTAPSPLPLARERFFHGDAPGQPCPETLDLTGLGRILVYGPYEPVTPGLWTATLRLEVCADGATRPFQFDVVTGADVTETRFRPGRPGAFQVQARHAVDADGLMELRLWVMKPTFHGELRLLGATLERGDSEAR